MAFSDEHAIETYKSLMLYGSAGLKFVLAANGAAAIAIMTFLGHFVAASAPNVPDLRAPLMLFVLGVVVGGFAIATSYFTQLTLYNESIGARAEGKKPNHVFWLRISMALILLGMLLFAGGALWCVSRLQ